MIQGINHITLAIENLEVSQRFYISVLGATLKAVWPKGCYLELGSIWLALVLSEQFKPTSPSDYSHLAWQVKADDFETMAAKIRSSGAILWQENHSEGDSLYFLDPNQHKLEIHSSGLKERLAHPWEGLEITEPT